ncbi:glutamate receptor ionotropic, kainate 1-like [Stegodyphus dumicola]|uniref:glutamate receptor ionotropic, kainate 1-like n=1 Tax=Stegodyphus dumicola TaxID=202533 RepID=UPI0015A9FC87|nr:glutamate receptor ionotropic, kainate 1-like [Stegodyphus dumicola]
MAHNAVGTSSISEGMRFPNFVKIAFMPVVPYLMLSNDGTAAGIEGRFLKVLSEFLKFRYEMIMPPDGEWGELKENGNWTGIVGMIQRQEADMSLLFITYPRLQALDFTAPYSTMRMVFATDIPGPLPRATFYMKVFQTTVWICCFSAIILLPLIYHFLLKQKYSFMRIFLEMIGTIAMQGLNVRDRAISDRFLIIFWLLSAYILSCSYTGSLSSFLTMPLKQPPLRNFIELSGAVEKGTHKFYARNPSPNIVLLKKSEYSYLRVLGQAIEKHQWNVYDHTQLSEIMVKNTAVMLPEPELLWKLGGEIGETKYLSDDVLALWYKGIGLRKGFCCTAKLNAIISKLHASGLYEKFIRDETFKPTVAQNDNATETDSEGKLSMDDIMTLFTLLICGYVLSFIVLLCEIFYFRLKQSERCEKGKEKKIRKT